MALIGRALALALCSTLSNQQLLEKHLEKHLLNVNVLQMLFGQCSQMLSNEAFRRAFAFIIYKIKKNI